MARQKTQKPIKIFPGMIYGVFDDIINDESTLQRHLNEMAKAIDVLFSYGDSSGAIDKQVKIRQEFLECLEKTVELAWRSLVEDVEKNETIIQEPAKLTISRNAFENCGDYKKGILRLVRKQVSAAEFEHEGVSTQHYPSMQLKPTILIWYFDPKVFLEVTSKYPWLLDSHLGEE